MEKYDILIFGDGACQPNPGKGGYGTIIKTPSSKSSIELSGYHPDTTNNRMELTAILKGFDAIKDFPGLRVKIITDSQYIVNGFTNGKMNMWKSYGWKLNKRTERLMKNPDLWEQLHDLSVIHKVTPEWVRGHSGHLENERCDELATSAIYKVNPHIVR